MNKTIPGWLRYACMACIIACAAVVVFDAAGGDISVSFLIMPIAMILSLFCAFIYSVKGFNKLNARWFKLFSVIYAVTTFISCVLMIKFANVFSGVLVLVRFGCACVLALALDLGKKKSFALGGIAVIVSATDLTAELIVGNPVTMPLNHLLLTVIYGMMLYGKYLDKASRGTK